MFSVLPTINLDVLEPLLFVTLISMSVLNAKKTLTVVEIPMNLSAKLNLSPVWNVLKTLTAKTTNLVTKKMSVCNLKMEEMKMVLEIFWPLLWHLLLLCASTISEEVDNYIYMLKITTILLLVLVFLYLYICWIKLLLLYILTILLIFYIYFYYFYTLTYI